LLKAAIVFFQNILAVGLICKQNQSGKGLQIIHFEFKLKDVTCPTHWWGVNANTEAVIIAEMQV